MSEETPETPVKKDTCKLCGQALRFLKRGDGTPSWMHVTYSDVYKRYETYWFCRVARATPTFHDE
jgi:hypothetical protein